MSNLAYFEDTRTNEPDKFIDAEIAPPPIGTDRLEPTEKEAYEALCREARPLVRNMKLLRVIEYKGVGNCASHLQNVQNLMYAYTVVYLSWSYSTPSAQAQY